MSKVKNLKHSYLAGFLDGDGSIHIRLKPNKTYRFGLQVSPNVVFYQSKKERQYLEELKKEYGMGYLRDRNDGIVEWIIGDMGSIIKLLEKVLPYLILKEKQAKLMLRIIGMKKAIKTAKDFFKMAKFIDQFETLNYSRKRKVNSVSVKVFLEKEGLLSP